MMTTYNLTIIMLVVECVLYFLIAAVALKRSDLQERATRALILYAAVSCLWVLGEVSWRLGWLDFLNAYAYILERMPSYEVLLLSLLFLHLSRSFLRLEGTGRGWWALGVAWIAAVVVLNQNLLALPEVLWTGNGWAIQRQQLGFGALVFGWGVFMDGATLLTARAYRRTQQPLHRNRITYWPLALGSTVAGAVLVLAGRELLGSGFYLLGTLSAAYVVLTYRLPDVRQMARRTVSYLIITLLTVVIYTAGFIAMQYLFQAVPGYSPLLAGAAMALILAIFFQPLLSLVQRLVNRFIFGVGYDPSHTLREYSMSVSNILELEHLATVAVSLISEAMEIQRGALFVVHYEKGENGEEDGNGYFRLRGVRGMGEDLPPGVLSADSPVAGYLCQERHPLTQYDIDLLPRFQATSAEERTWLSGLNMDVYVPIHAKGEWIGILALGPKVSGDRYFGDDLVLLSTLADQTAVALENARLVEDLIRAHDDLGQAYAALNQANRRLQELDKLKSAFIGVITHELRTPFANIVFSLELLERYWQKNLTPELREPQEQLLEQLTAGITSARTMVDNLVTFATFLSKQGELSLAWLDFGQVIQGSLLPLKSLAESKPITLQAEVPEELPPLHGDRDRLADAIYHLVHNAVKFTEAGGEVWVRCQATAYRVRFEVQDTGVGVPSDKLPTLWEDFTQMADPLRRGVEGLGLGLALVKYIVNAHGGDVWAQSEEGVGSTFGFHIPLVSAERPSLEEALKGVETPADTAKPVKTG